jgi:hypothetical protein
VSDPGLKVAQGRDPVAFAPLRVCRSYLALEESTPAGCCGAEEVCVSARGVSTAVGLQALRGLVVHMSTGSAPRALRTAPPTSARLSPTPRSVYTLLCPQRGGDARAGGPDAVFWRHVTPVPG